MADDLKPEGTFADRLRMAMGSESEAAFATRCPEVSRPLLRKYLAGSEPGMSKVIAIAKAAGVGVEWLATGEGEMRPLTPEVVKAKLVELEAAGQMRPQAAPAAAVDEELLARVGEEIVELYRQENGRVSQRQLARLQARLYADLVAAYDDQAERLVGLKGLIQQLRRDLRTTPVSGDAGKRLA